MNVNSTTQNLRNRFAGLVLCDPFCETPLTPCAVFSRSELESEPLKWLKYVLMDRIGVEPISRIESQVHRFHVGQIGAAEAWALRQFPATADPANRAMVIAKVVPWGSGAQLRNYRLFDANDAKVAFRSISGNYGTCDYEVWCCCSSVSTVGFNLGGRMTIPNGDRPQLLELVWFTSPRFLERVQLPNFAFPYLRAQRSWPNPAFRVDVLHIPRSFAAVPDGQWMADYTAVARSLNRRRSSMTRLAATVRSIGAHEVCFCFKVTNGRLNIIDWDSEIESTRR
jgi:hypothetical protein